MAKRQQVKSCTKVALIFGALVLSGCTGMGDFCDVASKLHSTEKDDDTMSIGLARGIAKHNKNYNDCPN